MRSVLIEIQERTPEHYPDWPVHFKKMFVATLEHYMNQDADKFRRIWDTVCRWAEAEDNNRVSFNVKEDEGTAAG